MCASVPLDLVLVKAFARRWGEENPSRSLLIPFARSAFGHLASEFYKVKLFLSNVLNLKKFAMAFRITN